MSAKKSPTVKAEKLGGRIVTPQYSDVIVYSMGKVASTSISMALNKAGIDCYDVHALSAERIEHSVAHHLKSSDHPTIPLNVMQSIEAYNATKVLDKISLIVPIREPVFRNVSAVFQNAPKKLSSEKIAQRLKKYRVNIPDHWFSSDFIPATGIDVFNSDIEPGQSFYHFEKGPFRVLIVKVETSDAEKSEAISKFLNKPVDIQRTNIGGNKWYSEIYKAIKENLDIVGPGFVDGSLSLKYFNTFYSAKERKALAARLYPEFLDAIDVKPRAKAEVKPRAASSNKSGVKPSISVITPSFNQAEFLQRNFDSVWTQQYAPIEQFVFDPGSNDGSRNIAKSHAKAKLIAEPDSGQADAVARGMLRSKGDIIAWLNSDDCYYDDQVFETVAKTFQDNPDVDIVYGRGVYVGKEDEYLRDAFIITKPEQLSWRLHKQVGILQPATFIRRRLIDKIGPVREDLNFCMDYEFWIRAMQSGAKFLFLDKPLAKARYYSDNKTMGARDRSLKEVLHMVKERFGYCHIDWIKRYAEYLVYANDGILNQANPFDTKKLTEILKQTSRLTRDFNGNFETVKFLQKRINKNPYSETAHETLRWAPQLPTYFCRQIDSVQRTVPNHQCYTVGPKRWAFLRRWKTFEIERSHDFVESYRKDKKHDVCIIVGNGPSLKKTDLSLLQGQDVFISNFAVLNETLRNVATFLSVTNYLVAEQGSAQFNELRHIKKLYPYWLSYCLLPSQDTYYFNSIGHNAFSTDYKKNISWRSTVTFFHMQMAFALGYKKVILIGVDNSYSQPSHMIEGDIIEQVEDDENHFDPSYFKGKKWQAADTDNMSAVYDLSKQAFEAHGRKIVNCTVGGKLDIFERNDLGQELKKK